MVGVKDDIRESLWLESKMISKDHYGWSQRWLTDDLFKFRLQSETQKMRVTVSIKNQTVVYVDEKKYMNSKIELDKFISHKIELNKFFS